MLSRNEVDRDYAYNRRLFVRLAQGWYQFNAALAMRRRDASGDSWLPVSDALNLRFVGECAHPQHWEHINALLAMAQQAPLPTPIAGEAYAKEMAEKEARYQQSEKIGRELEQKYLAAPSPRWGTKEARRMEVERIRREIAEKTAKRTGGMDDTI